MIIFDPYLPETWLADGLTVRVPAQKVIKRRTEKPGKGWKSVLTASIFSIGMTLLNVTFSAGDVRAGGAAFAIPGKDDNMRVSSEPEVKPGHWLKLVTLLRASPSLPEEDTANDPAPLA